MLSAAQACSLTAIAAITGAVLLWIWKRCSNQERIAFAKRQARARLYAMRLYADDPALVLRAQGQLLIWAARYMAGALRPTAITIVPILVLFLQLDNVYGRRAPAPGESALVTAQLSGGTDLSTLSATLEGRGVAVETAAVRIPGRRQICWRVRALPGGPGSLVLHVGGAAISKAFECGHAWWDWPPSVEVSCPAGAMAVFGLAIDWPVWFLLVSGLVMLVLRKPLGVVL
jgi:uncharacterized membrane protein (DUF106 family)